MSSDRPLRAAGLDAHVLIVGLGPTGAAAAALLGARGLEVRAYDRLPDLYPLPRAIGLDHEVMRVMQELGIAERVLPLVALYRPSEYRGMQGQLIKRLDAAPPPYRTGWPPNLVFDQPEFEQVLRARLGEMPRVKVQLSAEVLGVGQETDHVWADVRTSSGQMRRVSAEYLLACDGGASPIRKSLGIELDDLGFDEPWLVVDVIVSDETAKRLPQTQVQYCEAARPCTFVVGPGNHRRWEIMLLPGDTLSPEFPEAELWPLLSRWIGPGDGRLWRAAMYRFHGLIAREWRRGRILLAGDSAHMTPPFMAQGMVQGIRDAQNLSWKLARVIGRASPACLLDSYGIERRPHVEVTTRTAISLGREICERDPDRARARDELLLEGQGGVVTTMVRQDMIPGLRNGLIALDSPGAGVIFPQPMVRVAGTERCARLDDLTGPRLLVVALTAPSGAELAEFERRLRPFEGCFVAFAPVGAGLRVDVAVEEAEGGLVEWLKSLNATYAIVRPDHYVYATATAASEALLYLDRFVRHVASSAGDASAI
ncbi:MAG TPA: bifunctional 3-(3-hydroxy-phenyl)propionate/3-hydroxycinnamic acid hydroxylase [Steroidobacteraceae bacterium]|nr:bifunctional 3-(3-hydroxy-phenyl)propionate/3-hydroxycinnamic acid hydroxylase [Steroidobacteraceae bacterium]